MTVCLLFDLEDLLQPVPFGFASEAQVYLGVRVYLEVRVCLEVQDQPLAYLRRMNLEVRCFRTYVLHWPPKTRLTTFWEVGVSWTCLFPSET